MIKFLKVILFLVAFAFAFALGVRFSDSFKGKFGNGEEAEIKVEEEMKRVFDGHEQKINEIEIEPQNNPPIIIEESETISSDILNNTSDENKGITNQHSDAEVMESMHMDGIENQPTDMNHNAIDNQVIDFDNSVNVINVPEEAKTNGNSANPVETPKILPVEKSAPTAPSGNNTRRAR